MSDKKVNKLNIFGDQLRTVLELSGETMSYWAFELGVTRSAISQWINGDSIPTSKNLTQLIDKLREENSLKKVAYGAALKKFLEIFNEKLYKLSDKALNFRVDNLYDYISLEELNNLRFTIETIEIPSEDKEEFYSMIRDIVYYLQEVKRNERASIFYSLTGKKDSKTSYFVASIKENEGSDQNVAITG